MLRPQPSGALLPSYEGARRASLAEDYDYEAGFAVGEKAPGMGLYTEALAELCRRELGSSAACEQGPLEPGSEAYSEQLRRALIQAQRRQTPFDAPPPALQLAYKHMSKCGGSYLVSLLVNMTRGMHGLLNKEFFDEEHAVTPARRAGTFIIASMRNPCDYYVSLWAFQSQKRWSTVQNAAHGGTLWQPEATTCDRGRKCPLQPESANSDPDKFEAWVNLTMHTRPGHGILTYRFYDQLVEQRDSLRCWADNLLECADSFDDTAVSSGMASFDPDANVDCWVRNEMFDDDVKRCLVEYEQRSGVMLNWVAFDTRVPVMNKAGHAPCKHFFAAKPGLESRIMHADRELAHAFHYSSCCAPPLSARLQRGYAMEDNVLRPAGVPTDAEPAGAMLVRSAHAGAEAPPPPPPPPLPRAHPVERTPGPRLNVSRSSSRRRVEPPKLVVIASTQRGGSTELAEVVGMHPCGASFNELLVHGHFPGGYAKYKRLYADVESGKRVAGGLPEALNQQVGEEIVGSHLQHRRWLDDALRVRALFCGSRPQPVKDRCGEQCVVALKMHLNNYIGDARDAPWVELLTSPDVAVVVSQRGGLENYCSIAAATGAAFWGHSPAQCEAASDACAKAARLKQTCNAENSTKAHEWAAEVELRFDAARDELSRAGRLWLDVPFEQFVAEGGGEARSELAVRVLDHLDLGDPEVWDSCGLPWCANYSWPWKGSALAESPRAKDKYD